jgi:hypothetical protein
MDKKIIYGIGGVAVIGIIAYLYNKKKADDATKITTTAEAPTTDTGLITPPVVDEPNPIIDTNVIINPDGTWVDTSLISISTSPNTSSNTTTPSRDGTTSISSPTSSATPSKDIIAMTSTPTRAFDGGFDYFLGKGKGKKRLQYGNDGGIDSVLGF